MKNYKLCRVFISGIWGEDRVEVKDWSSSTDVTMSYISWISRHLSTHSVTLCDWCIIQSAAEVTCCCGKWARVENKAAGVLTAVTRCRSDSELNEKHVTELIHTKDQSAGWSSSSKRDQQNKCSVCIPSTTSRSNNMWVEITVCTCVSGLWSAAAVPAVGVKVNTEEEQTLVSLWQSVWMGHDWCIGSFCLTSCVDVKPLKLVCTVTQVGPVEARRGC